MSPVCPNGHDSVATDYCDLCGVRVTRAAAVEETSILPVVEELDTSPAVRAAPCPSCGAPRSGGDRFCEGCGFDFAAPPVVAAAWEAVVACDLERWEQVQTPGLSFPGGREQVVGLSSESLRIGRFRAGGDVPEIAPDDPAISRLHAVLERQDDGAYAIRDLGSTNGTTLGDGQPVSTEEAVPLADGDRVSIGAWTTITIRSAG